MANLYGTIRRMCPYCCENIEPGDVYEPARCIGSPIDGATIHAHCAVQRDMAHETEQSKTRSGQ